MHTLAFLSGTELLPVTVDLTMMSWRVFIWCSRSAYSACNMHVANVQNHTLNHNYVHVIQVIEDTSPLYKLLVVRTYGIHGIHAHVKHAEAIYDSIVDKQLHATKNMHTCVY